MVYRTQNNQAPPFFPIFVIFVCFLWIIFCYFLGVLGFYFLLLSCVVFLGLIFYLVFLSEFLVRQFLPKNPKNSTSKKLGGRAANVCNQ